MSGGVRKKFELANLTMPNNISSMKYTLKSVPVLADVGVPMGMGMVPEPHPDAWGVWKKIQMTNLTMPNNMFSMKYALKSVPGLAEVGVPHWDGDGPRTPT